MDDASRPTAPPDDAHDVGRAGRAESLSTQWYWEQDALLRFTHLSGGFERVTGMAPAQLLGRRLQEVPGLLLEAAALHEHACDSEARRALRPLPFALEATGAAARGWLLLGEPVHTAEGFAGYRGIAHPLHDRPGEALPGALWPRLLGLAGVCYWEQDADLTLTRVEGDRSDPLVHWLHSQRGRSLAQLGGDGAAALREACAAGGDGAALHLQLLPPGAAPRWLSLGLVPLQEASGRLRGHAVLARDVTVEYQGEAALARSEARLRDFAAAAGEALWETDAQGRLVSVAGPGLSAARCQALVGLRPWTRVDRSERARVLAWLREHRGPDRSFRDLELPLRDPEGQLRWLLVNAMGTATGLRGSARDITERKGVEARANFLATRDPLTELPNRLLFNDRLEQGLMAARRSGQLLALMFIDLDRFKQVNDTLGHPVGDLLLREVAARMLGALRRGDTLSRLGGDEFVVTLEGLQNAEDAAQVAAKIIRAVSRPYVLAGHPVNISCSLGIGIYPNDGLDARTLMKNADTAMYFAKERGRANYQFFSPEMNRRAVERQQLAAALRGALERGEFRLHYQPTTSVPGGRVLGVEALLRWQHPERGLLAPPAFIGVAESSGLMESIGRWVLETACGRAQAWRQAGHPPVRVSVNISARQLASPREFLRSVGRALSQSGLPPQQLVLEMTEALLLQHAESNLSALRRLGQDGVRLVVDDFGRGFSSLAHLRQLPVYGLKVDRGFMRDLGENGDGRALVRTAAAIASSLGLALIAEGVETREQLQALVALGCTEYQGYLFSRPLPEAELIARHLAPGQLSLFD